MWYWLKRLSHHRFTTLFVPFTIRDGKTSILILQITYISFKSINFLNNEMQVKFFPWAACWLVLFVKCLAWGHWKIYFFIFHKLLISTYMLNIFSVNQHMRVKNGDIFEVNNFPTFCYIFSIIYVHFSHLFLQIFR